MKKMNVFTIILITSLFSISACSNQTPNSGGSSNKGDSPYTTVTLTEEGAARVNAGLKRQSTIRQRYAKYSSWLKPNFLDETTEDEVKAGDEVEENMNFEIYPNDLDSLDKMFLIGRTKPSSSDQTKDSFNRLIEITTNISKEEIPDYSLNGQISYINGSGNINHDTIQFDSIPYQESTEFTMTYTYIKKGTSADTSPYSCQPSFNITKVDNEAPKYENSHPYWEDSGLSNIKMSYTVDGSRLRTSLAETIGRYFTINDNKLTKTVTINKTDIELEALRQTAIAGAKAASDHHFESFTIPFTVSTQNASTEELTCSVLLVDDVFPAIKKDGVEVDSITLNGGTDLALPSRKVVNKGANALLRERGYVVDDYIEGQTSVICDVIATWKYDRDYYEYSNYEIGSAVLTMDVSFNGKNATIVDDTTKFNWHTPCTNGSFRFNSYYANSDLQPHVYYSFNYNDGYSYSDEEIVCSSDVDLEYEFREDHSVVDSVDITLINQDPLVINKNTVFKESFIPISHHGYVYDSKIVIIDLNHPLVYGYEDAVAAGIFNINSWDTNYDDFRPTRGNKIYISSSSIGSLVWINLYYLSGDILNCADIYTDAQAYNPNWYFDDSKDYFDICFFGKIDKGTVANINYGCSLEQFKTMFNVNY